MAKRLETVLVDDLDGSAADETVVFGLDGRHYEIDLTEENARSLRETIRGYTRSSRAVAPPQKSAEPRLIRRWAAANGYQVSERGRIHRDVVEAYRNAGRKGKPKG